MADVPAAPFVDIHSHVLHGLDDGAASLEESVAMLAIAEAGGTSDLVATPHANSQYAFRPEVVAQRIDELQARTRVRLHPGCDFHLHADNIHDALAHPEKYTINHGAYLLVEFPDMGVFRAADEIFRQLLEAGLVPIISHPERNPHVMGQLPDLARWVGDGCYVQVTAGSYEGLFGREVRRGAVRLFEAGLTHFVASDAHSPRRRTPDLRPAYDKMCDRWGEAAVRPLFVENPAAAVRSETLPFEPPVNVDRARTWYRFWR